MRKKRVSSEWTVVDYVDSDGKAPVRAFVETLTPAERGRFFKRVQYLRLDGLRAGPDVFLNMSADKAGDPKGKLWELRMPKSQHNPRVLGFPTAGRKIVLLHGFKKIGMSSDKIARADIDIAIERMHDYLERMGTV